MSASGYTYACKIAVIIALGTLVWTWLQHRIPRQSQMYLPPILDVTRLQSHHKLLDIDDLLSSSDYKNMTEMNSKSRVKAVCERIRRGYYVIPPAEDANDKSLRAFADHFHQVMYCETPKAGSTSFYYVIKRMVEKEKAERKTWFQLHVYDWYYKADRFKPFHKLGFNQVSVGDDAHQETKDGLPDPRLKYYKFMVVRHPLERLASAYLEKVTIYRRNVKNIKDFVVGKKKYDPREPINISFKEFLMYVAQPDKYLTDYADMHYRTYQSGCEPCSIEYDYIGHLETIGTDVKQILPHWNASESASKFPAVKLKKTGDNRYAHMYRELPASIVQPILDKYKADADMFGYSFEMYAPDSMNTTL